jgi:hypothetical protein
VPFIGQVACVDLAQADRQIVQSNLIDDETWEHNRHLGQELYNLSSFP